MCPHCTSQGRKNGFRQYGYFISTLYACCPQLYQPRAEKGRPKSGLVPSILKGMSQERACPRRPSAPPGEMLQGTRSHLTCITSNRMIRVMVAMLTRWMISARATSTDSDGRLFFVIFISLRLYQCTMRQSSHGLASDLHS